MREFLSLQYLQDIKILEATLDEATKRLDENTDYIDDIFIGKLNELSAQGNENAQAVNFNFNKAMGAIKNVLHYAAEARQHLELMGENSNKLKGK